MQLIPFQNSHLHHLQRPSMADSPININNENYKLVPWLNWEEWDHVRLSLFSSSPLAVSTALRRIATWRSRGCLPVAVEITASFVGIQLSDPYFSGSSISGALDSEELLAMLYTTAIMRLVNGIIERTRKNQKISIAVAAEQINLPRVLIDLRHEGSHRELPSLHLLRRASVMALDWLKSYYWDRQKDALPYKSRKSASVRKEIRSRLRELASTLKLKHNSGSSSSENERKSGKHHEKRLAVTVTGRNKLFSLVACKLQSSNNAGPKKQIMKTLKNLVRLYSLYSSDVISVFLAFLFKASNSTDLMTSPENFQFNLTIEVARAVFDEWEPVLSVFSKKEPELLPSLLKAVLDLIESHKVSRDDFGSEHFSLSQYDSKTQDIRILSSLFAWLVQLLKGLYLVPHEGEGSQKENDYRLPGTTLIELMKRCLRVSDPEDLELRGSTLLLAELVGGNYLNGKIHKLSRLAELYSGHSEELSSDVKVEELIHQDKYIRQAAEKLEMVKHNKLRNASSLNSGNDNAEDGNRWTIAKSWNPCPIGMLPHAVGSSGCLPILDFGNDHETEATLNFVDIKDHPESTYCNKREATCTIEPMDGSSVKRMKATQDRDLCQSDDFDLSQLDDFNSSQPGDLNSSQPDNMSVSESDGVEGRLLIGGCYQKVGDQEIQKISSRVRLLVTQRKT